MAEKHQSPRPGRTAVTAWFALLAGVVATTAVGFVTVSGPIDASRALDLVALAIGVLATGFVIVVPVRMQTGYLKTIARGETPQYMPRDGGTPVEQTPEGALMTVLLVRLAFAEAPALAAFVLALRQGGYSLAGMSLVALSLVLFALAYPRPSAWALFARQVEAARTAGPIAVG